LYESKICFQKIFSSKAPSFYFSDAEQWVIGGSYPQLFYSNSVSLSGNDSILEIISPYETDQTSLKSIKSFGLKDLLLIGSTGLGLWNIHTAQTQTGPTHKAKPE